MTYTVQKLADIAGVSVRTLHHYDDIGLLKPARVKNNGYRFYDEPELLKLQQILFFRELDFPLSQIKIILNNPQFNMKEALSDQRKMIELKKKRLEDLTRTIDKTIKKINKQIIMKDEELYKSFMDNGEKYKEEAKERWGNTERYKESIKRVSKMSKEDMIRVQKEGDALMKKIAENMNKGPESKEIQALIEKHYNNLRNFYEPSLEMYKGLGEMYVSDPRFTAYFEKYAVGLAMFMREAIYKYCANNK